MQNSTKSVSITTHISNRIFCRNRCVSQNIKSLLLRMLVHYVYSFSKKCYNHIQGESFE